MEKRDIIVIGGSTGSLSVLKEMVKSLPAELPAAIFIVWHIAPNSPGILGELLGRLGSLPAENASNNQKIEKGRIYVAPPDHHLLIEEDFIKVSKGPKENRFRPAIDPLFRSAAAAYGARVVGVILSGGLDDGVAGLWTIKEYGGIAVVQDPSDAENPSMPLSARKRVEVDYCVPGNELADLLIRLCKAEVQEKKQLMTEKSGRTGIEIKIADGEEALLKGVLELGKPSYFTCPECQGVLIEIVEGKNIRFRCHTGHAYSSGTLLTEIAESIEDKLWNSIRAIDENIMLLNHLSSHLKEQDAELAEIYEQEALRIHERSKKVREAVLEVRKPPFVVGSQ
jgi:two-component system, chemotaxis family, protein-glutamate methylesterase/glutaminase